MGTSLLNKKNALAVGLVLAGLCLLAYKPIISRFSPAKLETQIQHQPVIMPAVYKVYANENALEGKYSLFKMLITNNSSNAARNVEVAYQIPNYIDWKTVTKFPIILPGQSVVVNCYPSFTDKIAEKTTSSKEQVNIKINGSNIEEMEKSFPIDIKGRNEFMYTCIPSDEIRTAGEYFDNMDLLSCYVTPEDPVVKYFTQKIQEKVLKGETAAVENKEKEGVRFLTGIYYATLLSRMVYSGTSGVPAKIEDVSSIIQSIRLPREVITGKTGLCIELSLLYASIMMNAGMDPIIYLIPGHAYPGFRMNGQYYAIESTGIGGEGMGGRMSTEKAFQLGMKNLNEFFQHASTGDDRYRIVDIRESIKKGALAMELKDDSYLRQKVDEIAASFEQGSSNTNVNVQPGYTNTGNEGGAYIDESNENAGIPGGYNLYEGAVTFAYPGSWRIVPRTSYMMPQLKHQFANSSNTAFLEVYQFNGISNPAQALYAIQQYLSQYGGSLQFSASGQTASGYALYSGQSFYNGVVLNWIAAFKSTGNGVSGISVGATSNTGSKYQSTAQKIINSLR